MGRRPSLLQRLERQLMHILGPADVRSPDSQRPDTDPPVRGEVIEGEFERTDAPPDPPTDLSAQR